MTWTIAAAGAVGGAIVGSFVATICIRWPEGRQVLTGRSSCDHCKRTLGAAELIPVLSSAMARGRCRSCGGKIAPLHLGVELGAASLAAVALLLQPNVSGLALALFWLLLVGPAILDARHLWLPNSLTAILAFPGLLFGGLATGAALTDRLAGGAAGFLVLALVAAAYAALRGRQGMGAGDPKLFGAIGLWTGWMPLPFILVIASVAGLALALARGRAAGDRMPFGSLMAAGAIIWSGVEVYRQGGAF
ncbi:MAG: prepilin peptidase [Sphingomonas sp.]|nr:prepilin peptidase [Sphingomonas sp.]